MYNSPEERAMITRVMRLADRPDFFVSEELTARFKDEPREVHVLCYGIDPDDHARLQERAGDVEAVAEYLHGRGILAALAHPFWEVEEPLTLPHRRRLAQLFPVWEVRSGYFGTALNALAESREEAGEIDTAFEVVGRALKLHGQP